MTGSTQDIQAPATLALIGLGQMGVPMALNLARAGFQVRGHDVSAPAREAFVAAGGQAADSLAEAVAGVAAVILMLPNGAIVRSVVMDPAVRGQLAAAGSLVIDMSSSAPVGTIALGGELAAHGIRLIDAPVSGGVKRARDASLAIMAGGEPAHIAAARPVLEAMGKSIFETGPLGSAHAMKALNNFVSAAGLVAAAEAVLVGARFGLQPDVIVDVLNASTGRNNATEVKMKQFVNSGTFNSGFSLALMAKDLATAADLGRHLEMSLPSLELMAGLWARATQALPAGADHTEIYRHLASIKGDAP